MGKAIKTIEDLQPDPRNANRGTPRGHGIIEHSVRNHGAGRSGLAANDGTMIAGSQTLEEMAALGIKIKPVHTTGDEWVVVIRDDVEPGSEQAALMAIEDNRAAQLGIDFDPAILSELSADMDLSVLFRDEELAELLAGVGEPEAGREDDDDAPAIDENKPTRVQPGDVWRVGEHLVCCLDSTDRANIEKWAGQVTFVVADPPYGVKAVGKDGRIGSDYSDNKTPGYERFKGYSANVYAPVIGDETTDTAIDAALLMLDFYPQSTQVWWGANHYAQALPPSPCWVVWDKENDGDDFPDAELAWVNRKSAVRIFRHMWKGMLRASEVNEKRVHPTQKPVALFLWLYERYGKPGDLILDPFLGSGPSLKAAHRMGDRRVVGFELSPHYCDHVLSWAESNGLICERLEQQEAESVV